MDHRPPSFRAPVINNDLAVRLFLTCPYLQCRRGVTRKTGTVSAMSSSTCTFPPAYKSTHPRRARWISSSPGRGACVSTWRLLTARLTCWRHTSQPAGATHPVLPSLLVPCCAHSGTRACVVGGGLSGLCHRGTDSLPTATSALARAFILCVRGPYYECNGRGNAVLPERCRHRDACSVISPASLMSFTIDAN